MESIESTDNCGAHNKYYLDKHSLLQKPKQINAILLLQKQ